MPHRNYFRYSYAVIGICTIVILAMTTTACFSDGLRREKFIDRLKNRQKNKTARDLNEDGSGCDRFISNISSGYGADGEYDMEIRTLSNPLWGGKDISILFPKGVTKKCPVIFFSHGYGASDWLKYYTSFMHHIVSKGYIVVFSPYQTFGARMEDRYNTLWKGFEVAVQEYKDKMDLTKVGFVGHSFGGGATPAMAYKGLWEKGWGEKAAFLYVLAPWYSYGIDDEKLTQYPDNTILVMQLYDKDETNDHRMGIDIFKSIQLPENQKFFQMIRSQKINDCMVVADHLTPTQKNSSLRLKQYAVFKPFDALSDISFNGNSDGDNWLSNPSGTSFQPISSDKNLTPQFSESTYRFSWDDRKNKRRYSKKW